MNQRTYFVISFSFLGLGLIAFLIDVFKGKPDGDGLVILIIGFAITAFWLIRFYIALRRIKEVGNLLSQQCDPDAYIEKTQRLLDKATKGGHTANTLMFRLNLSAGLSAEGRFEEALAATPDTVLFKNDRNGRLGRFTVNHNTYVAFLSLGNMEQAALALERLHDSLNALKDNKLYKMVQHLSQLDSIRFEMVNGHFENAENAYRNTFDKAKSNIERVSAMLRLGETYQHYGRNEEAREAFEYVIAHGNKLYAVTLAKQLLASMGNV